MRVSCYKRGIINYVSLVYGININRKLFNNNRNKNEVQVDNVETNHITFDQIATKKLRIFGSFPPSWKILESTY